MTCEKKLGQIVLLSVLMFSWVGCEPAGKNSNNEIKTGTKENNKSGTKDEGKSGTKEEVKSGTTTSDVMPLAADKAKILKDLGDVPFEELSNEDKKKVQDIVFDYEVSNLDHGDYKKYISPFCFFVAEKNKISEEQCKKKVEDCKAKFNSVSKDDLAGPLKADEQKTKNSITNEQADSALTYLKAIEFAGTFFEEANKLSCTYKKDEFADVLKKKFIAKFGSAEDKKIEEIYITSAVIIFFPFLSFLNPASGF